MDMMPTARKLPLEDSGATTIQSKESPLPKSLPLMNTWDKGWSSIFPKLVPADGSSHQTRMQLRRSLQPHSHTSLKSIKRVRRWWSICRRITQRTWTCCSMTSTTLKVAEASLRTPSTRSSPRVKVETECLPATSKAEARQASTSFRADRILIPRPLTFRDRGLPL